MLEIDATGILIDRVQWIINAMELAAVYIIDGDMVDELHGIDAAG